LFVLLALPAAGLEPYLVKDINPVPSPAGGGPAAFAALGGRAVFEASDGSDRVLWMSDGTAEGTRVLVDTCPGCADAVEALGQVGERLFFLAYAEPGRKSLWVTDGRTAERLSGPLSAGRESVVLRGVLYFVADGGLWRTDGTAAGTFQVLAAPASQLTAFDGQVWFVRGIRGKDLWRGTALVRRFSRPPRILGGVGRRLVIAAGDELLTLNGVLARGISVIDSAVLGGRLWLIAETRQGQELWVSDGFTARQLTSFPRKPAFFAPAEALYLTLPRSLTAGRLVFAAHDGAHGPELWTSDGTAAGTRLLRDLCPGPCAGVGALGPGRYFIGTDGVHGHELWSTDGSRVDLVRDVCPGPCDGNPGSLATLGDRVLFAADDGEHGIELWTAEGRLSDFEPPVPWPALRGAALPGEFLFGANDGEHGLELWATDGASARLVKDLDETDMGGSFPSGLSALGNTAFFFADDGEHGYELWKSDGTAAGTVLIAELVPGEEPREPPEVRGSAVVGGELYLAVDEALWRTDGTAVHKVMEVDAREPIAFQGSLFLTADRALWRGEVRIPGPDNPRFLTVHAGRLWFFDDLGLWSSDGTTAVLESEGLTGSLLASVGDRLVVSRDADPGTAWTVFQGRLYYTADGRLWVSDGEESHPIPGAPGGATFAPLGDRLLFTTEGSGIPLWITDGVEAVKVRDLAPRFVGRVDLLAVGPRVFFPALDPATGVELWMMEEDPEE
jgi:ELWxxDGT repeat protein